MLRVGMLVFAVVASQLAHGAGSGDSGIDMIAAHSACDGSVFKALAADAARWKKEPSFRVSRGMGGFHVDDRKPKENAGRNGDAVSIFRKPVKINDFLLTGWFDSDLSAWSRFSRYEISFLTWGFYIDADSADVRDWLRRRVPAIGRRLQASSAEKEGVFCIDETWQNGKWVAQSCTADEAFPTDPVPHRWLVIRPDGPGSDQSVLSCELTGKLDEGLLKQLRPDL